jgi:hypothetical protein
MVEIFRTNVKNRKLAERILKNLQQQLPEYQFNFDLDDCDRILRVQGSCDKMETCKIIQTVQEHLVEILLLEE